MDKKNNKEIDIKELINPYLKKWKYFVGMVFLMLILAVYYIKSSPQVFKSQTSVLIKDAKKISPAGGDVGMLQSLGGLSGMGTSSIENEMGVFESKSIIEDVVREHDFQTPVYAKQTFKSVELYGTTSPYIINVIQERNSDELPKKPIFIKSKNNQVILSSEEWDKEILTSFDTTINLPFALIMIRKNPGFKAPKKTEISEIYFNFSDFESAVNQFQDALKVDLLDKDGTIITLSVDFQNKDKAKDFLNSLVRQYNVYAINDKNIESKRTKDFVDNRITLISKELGDVETQKEGFKSSNSIVDLRTEAGMNLQLKEQSKAAILEIGTQLEITQMLQNSLSRKGNGDVLPLNIGLDNEAAGNAIQQYNALVLQRNKYLQDATPDNPLVKTANNQIEEIKSSLTQSLQRNITSLELAKRKVESQLGSSQQMIGKIPEQEKLFRSIERQQQIKENLYLLLLQKREEAAISMEIVSEKARVIDKAFVFKKPVAPQKLLVLLIATVIGILIPLVYFYLKTILNSKLIDKLDLEKLTTVPLLAEIPRISGKESDLVRLNDVTPLAESFRILVTNMNFMISKKDNDNVIFITSTVKGEGKTFVSVNLALALASLQKKVLVIGSDIRNPQLQRYNPSMKDSKGLTEYLYGDIDNIQDIINPSGINPNCDFIYSGSIPPNPADLLQNGRYEILLESLKGKYQYIILDTAPLMLVTDSFLISGFADATIYVTRSEVTEKDFIAFANKNVESQKIKNVGFILNDVHKTNFGYGNKYGYGYKIEKKRWFDKVKRRY